MEDILDLGYRIIMSKTVPNFKDRADKFKKGLAVTVATFDNLHLVENPNKDDYEEYRECKENAVIGLRILQDMFPMLEYFSVNYIDKINLNRMTNDDFKMLYETLVSLETLLRNLYNIEIERK